MPSVQRTVVHRGVPDRIGDDDAADGRFGAPFAEVASQGFRFTEDGVHCFSFAVPSLLSPGVRQFRRPASPMMISARDFQANRQTRQARVGHGLRVLLSPIREAVVRCDRP
jgi:hypothetical protein